MKHCVFGADLKDIPEMCKVTSVLFGNCPNCSQCPLTFNCVDFELSEKVKNRTAAATIAFVAKLRSQLCNNTLTLVQAEAYLQVKGLYVWHMSTTSTDLNIRLHKQTMYVISYIIWCM